MPNPFVHVELNTDDVTTAKRFYKGLFDWKLTDVQMGPGMVYTMLDVGEGTGGGMQQKPMPNAPTMWLSYVLVDDVAETLIKARQLGAMVVVESMPIMGQGTLGVFIDPTGAALGLWQPEKMKKATKKKTAKKKAAKKQVAKKKTAKKSKRR